MKRTILIILLVLWASAGWGATTAYVSTATGNLNDQTKWRLDPTDGSDGNDGYPVSGCTMTVTAGTTITVTSGVSVGTAGQSGGNVDILVSGGLVVASGVTLTITGRTMLSGGILQINDGSGWLVDDGNYNFTFTGANYLNIIGTSGSRAIFQADAGNYTWIDDAVLTATLNINAQYANIGLGGGASYGFDFHGSGNVQNILFDHCKLTLPTRCDYANGSPPAVTSTFKFVNCDLRGLTSSYSLVAGSGATWNFTGEHGFWNCTIAGNTSGSIYLFRTGPNSSWTLNNVVSEYVNWQLSTPADLDYVAENHDNGAQTAFTFNSSGGPVSVDNCVVWGDITNWHAFDSGTTGVVSFTGNFTEGSDSTGAENHYVATTSGATVTLTQNITKGGNAIITRRTFSTGGVTVQRHTHFGFGNDTDALYIDEGPSEYNRPETIRSCLIHATQGVARYKALTDGTIVTSMEITYADYNGYYDVSGISRYNNTTISGKAVGDDGFGLHDVSGDPLFVGGGSGVTTWDVANGGPGTVTNAWGEMLKMNGFSRVGSPATLDSSYTVSNLLTYIRGQYTPQNPALNGTGYNGEDIGAVDLSSDETPTIRRQVIMMSWWDRLKRWITPSAWAGRE